MDTEQIEEDSLSQSQTDAANTGLINMSTAIESNTKDSIKAEAKKILE